MSVRQLFRRSRSGGIEAEIDGVRRGLPPEERFYVAKERGESAAKDGRRGEAVLWYSDAVKAASAMVSDRFKDSSGNVHKRLIEILQTGIVYQGDLHYHRDMNIEDTRWAGRVADMMGRLSDLKGRARR